MPKPWKPVAQRPKSLRDKQVIYFDPDVLDEIEGEASRLERSTSYILRKAWSLAMEEIRKLPAPPAVDSDDEDDEVAA